MSDRVERRKTRLVNINTQRAFALRLLGHSLLVVWVLGLSFIGMQALMGPFENPQQWQQFLHVSLLSFIFSIFCTTPLLLYDALTYSHRFAGPVARLQSLIQQAGHGRPVELMRLRKNDFWVGVAEDFNRLMERINTNYTPRVASATGEQADEPSAEQSAECAVRS